MSDGSVIRHQIQIPPKLIEVFSGKARIRGAYGGRGSAKSRTFAKMLALRGDEWSSNNRQSSGVILCAREFQNSLRDSSFAEVAQAIRSDAYLVTRYEIGVNFIKHVNGNLSFIFMGLRHNLDSIKGTAGVIYVWVDEAETVPEEAWAKLMPSVRGDENAEIWVTWNPESERSATHKRFRVGQSDRMKIVEMNWRDNPWFPAVLNDDRLEDLKNRPEDYEHVWEGAFKTEFKGAYWSRELAAAKAEGRISDIARHPNMQVRTFWDLGRRDHTAIWVAQFVDTQIRVIDFIEARGQAPGYYFNELIDRGYKGCMVVLPHDGSRVGPDNASGLSYEDQARSAGFDVQVIRNQGAGAAKLRIDVARTVFPSIRFDAEKCADGLKALAAYHEDWDDKRDTGRGPLHDWSSHAADAFGLMCVAYQEPRNIHGDGEISVGNFSGW